MRRGQAHRRPIEKPNPAMRRFDWRIAAFETNIGAVKPQTRNRIRGC